MAKNREQQKKADETLVDLVEVRDQAQDFMSKYQNYLFGGLVAIVLVIGGLVVWNFRTEQRNAEAVEQMMQAQIQFERDSFALALTNPGQGYDGFLDILENYGGTKAANLANYYIGVSYLNLGSYDAAISYLKDFSPAGDVLPIMKYGALGDAYSELNDMEQALSYYQRAVKAGEIDPLVSYYLKKMGMLHEHNGDYAAALEAYQQIKEDYPLTPEGRDIEKYITRASAKS